MKWIGQDKIVGIKYKPFTEIPLNLNNKLGVKVASGLSQSYSNVFVKYHNFGSKHLFLEYSSIQNEPF